MSLNLTVSFPKHLAVNIENHPKATIWQFYNQEETLNSCIYRIEVCKGETGIQSLDLYFNPSSISIMREKFSTAHFIHNAEANFYQAQFLSPDEIRSILKLVKNENNSAADQQIDLILN